MGKERIISFVTHEFPSIKNKLVYKPGIVDIHNEVIEPEWNRNQPKKAGEVVSGFREEVL